MKQLNKSHKIYLLVFILFTTTNISVILCCENESFSTTSILIKDDNTIMFFKEIITNNLLEVIKSNTFIKRFGEVTTLNTEIVFDLKRFYSTQITVEFVKDFVNSKECLNLILNTISTNLSREIMFENVYTLFYDYVVKKEDIFNQMPENVNFIKNTSIIAFICTQGLTLIEIIIFGIKINSNPENLIAEIVEKINIYI